MRTNNEGRHIAAWARRQIYRPHKEAVMQCGVSPSTCPSLADQNHPQTTSQTLSAAAEAERFSTPGRLGAAAVAAAPGPLALVNHD